MQSLNKQIFINNSMGLNPFQKIESLEKTIAEQLRKIEELEEKQKGGGELNAGTRPLGCTPSRRPRPWP